MPLKLDLAYPKPAIIVDTDGNPITPNDQYVWNPNTLAWERMQQPILNAGTVIISGTITVTGTVAVSSMPVTHVIIDSSATIAVTLASTTVTGSVAVTGTFWQTTQPVSIAGTVAVSGPLTDTQLRASAVPVSLATLPALTTGSAVIGHVIVDSGAITVSGTVAFSNSTIAVTNAGTFVVQASWAAAQHIIVDSGSLTVTLASTTITGTVAVTQSTSPWVVSLSSTTITGSVAVTGTFWQVTQPISGSVTVSSGDVTVSGGDWLTAAQTLTAVTTVGTITNPVAVTNIGLTDLNTAILTLGSSTVPTLGVVVGGMTTDPTPVFDAIALGPGGRSVVVEPYAADPYPRAMLREIRMLRFALQSAFRQGEPFDDTSAIA